MVWKTLNGTGGFVVAKVRNYVEGVMFDKFEREQKMKMIVTILMENNNINEITQEFEKLFNISFKERNSTYWGMYKNCNNSNFANQVRITENYIDEGWRYEDGKVPEELKEQGWQYIDYKECGIVVELSELQNFEIIERIFKNISSSKIAFVSEFYKKDNGEKTLKEYIYQNNEKKFIGEEILKKVF